MITTHKKMEMLTGREIVDSLVESIRDCSPDFAEDHQRFQESISYFEAELGEAGNPSVDDLVSAIHRQTVSNWLFSGYLGLQANLDHFRNPVARTFMDVDPEIYLRECTAKMLPEYMAAQKIIDDFCSQIAPEQREVYENVKAYIADLETIVPKLAHYSGYILGNELLPFVMHGYKSDVQLSIRYSMMIKELWV